MTAATLPGQQTFTFGYTKAVKRSDLPPSVRLVLVMLNDRANPDGTFVNDEGNFTPSLRELMEETGLSRDTVVRCLDIAEEAKWVIRDKPTSAEQYRHKKTQYTLTYPAGKQPLERAPRVVNDPGPGVVEDLIPDPSRSPQMTPENVPADPSDYPPKTHNPSSEGSTTIGPPLVRQSDQGWSDDRTLKDQNFFQIISREGAAAANSPAPAERPRQEPPSNPPPEMPTHPAPPSVLPMPGPEIQPCGQRHPEAKKCGPCGTARKANERAEVQAKVDAERAHADAHPAHRTKDEALNAAICDVHGGLLSSCAGCRAAQHPRPPKSAVSVCPESARQQAMAAARAHLTAQKAAKNTGGT